MLGFKESVAFGRKVSDRVSTVVGAESSKDVFVKGAKGGSGVRGVRGVRGREGVFRGIEGFGKVALGRVGGNGFGSGGLRESKPKFKGVTGKGNTGIKSGGIDGRPEGKIRQIRRPGGDIGGDDAGTRETEMGAEAEADKVRKGEEGGADTGADGSGFNSGVVRTAWNVTEGGDQFGGAVKERMVEKKVGEEVKAAGFEVSSGMNSGRTGHKKFNGIGGAAEGEGDEGGACGSRGCRWSRHAGVRKDKGLLKRERVEPCNNDIRCIK